MTHVVSMFKNARPFCDGLEGFNKMVHFVPVHQYDYNKFEEVVLVLAEVGTNKEGNLVDKVYLQGPRKAKYTAHKLMTADTMDLNAIIRNKLDELDYEQITFGDSGPAILRRDVSINDSIKVTPNRVNGNNQTPRYFLGDEVLQILKEDDNGEAYITQKVAADLQFFDVIVIPRTLEIIEVLEVSKATTSAMCIIAFVRDKGDETNSVKEWLSLEDYEQRTDLDRIERDIYHCLIMVDAIN